MNCLFPGAEKQKYIEIFWENFKGLIWKFSCVIQCGEKKI